MPSSVAAARKEPRRAAASKAVKARSGGRSRLAKLVHHGGLLVCDIIGELAGVVRFICADGGEIGAGGVGFKKAKIVQEFPHPPLGHLLPLEETGEGNNISLLPRLFAGEGARRADEGPMRRRML